MLNSKGCIHEHDIHIDVDFVTDFAKLHIYTHRLWHDTNHINSPAPAKHALAYFA